jgi:DNA-binding SARP family transcriptional activator/tetratricopeptide (TPR) repeat protein
VEFGLLGPLLVRAEEKAIAISAGKQRVLLAALLLAVNQVVAVDKLTEALWQGSPPETARVTLQNYIMRLRHTLGPAGYERIVSRPAGYLIEVRRGELDVAQFAELQAAGVAAARAGAWESASSQLAAALGLWRGQPLADIQSPLLVAEAPRLAEMRLAALESRIDADLHLGRHREVTAGLAALAAAEPLRERVHELLMLALYRSGQQAAALAAYRNTRRKLVGELGIEPGPALRELNLRIQRADPSLLLPGTRERGGAGGIRPSDAAPRPRMLPAEVPGFTGREAELAAVSALLPEPPDGDRAAPITVISGMAGVGKTALAVHWAHQHAGGFPGGQLYVNLRGFGPADPLRPAEALRIFLDALAVPAAQIPATLDGRQSVYRSRLAGTKTLIVLDNAGGPDQVRPLLPGAPGCLVIVTSRNQLAGLIAADGAQAIVLDVLTSGEAHHVLARRLGPDRVAAEPAAAGELARLCARLPLALAVTGARAAARPDITLTTLAAELRDTRGRLDALTTGEDTTDVRAVFSWSYHQLSTPAARMFQLLGLHPGPDTTAAAAASLTGLDPGHARRLLRELTHAHLLTEHTPGRYTSHDLLRAYAAEQADASEAQVRHEATARMLDHYLHTAHTAARLMQPHRGAPTPDPARPGVTPEPLASYQEALAWFEAEHRVLAAALALAAEAGFDVHAWQLPWALASFLDWRGHWHEWAAVERAAVAAAIRLGDKTAQAMARRSAAAACLKIGAQVEAGIHQAECLALYRQLGDRAGEARIRQDLSGAAEMRGRYADALAHSEQALVLFRATANRAGEANALNSIGWCHAQLGNPRQARTVCQQALSLYRELGNRYCEAHVWDSLGYAELLLGHLAGAADRYRHALTLIREVGDRFGEADILTHLGDAREAAGDQPGAREAWRQALTILDDLHHPAAESVRAKLAGAGRQARPGTAHNAVAVRPAAGARR